jgi:hypothetical protein
MELFALLLIVGAILLVLGLGTVMVAPIAATRAAAAASKPKLERRASGDDRMRALINAQRTERSRTKGLAQTLTRSGLILSGLSVASFIGGAIAWAMGY